MAAQKLFVEVQDEQGNIYYVQYFIRCCILRRWGDRRGKAEKMLLQKKTAVCLQRIRRNWTE